MKTSQREAINRWRKDCFKVSSLKESGGIDTHPRIYMTKEKAWKYEKFTIEQVKDAISKAHGIKSQTCRLLGCATQTLYNYIERYPQLKDDFIEASNIVKDVAESKLFEAIQAGEPWAICFYLKNQGGDRGYNNRVEVTGKDGQPVQFVVTDAKERLISGINIVNGRIRENENTKLALTTGSN